MKQFLLFLILSCFFNSSVFAQKLYGDRTSLYVNVIGNWATGLNKQNLQRANVGTAAIGASAGFLYNVKKDVQFPLSLGAEFGIQNMGRDAVSISNGNGLSVSNNAYWVNGMLRYRPVYWASIINPFVDLGAGPMVVSTGILEQLNQDESTRIDGKNTVVFNTTIGIGAGLKLPRTNGHQLYLDVGLYFRQTGSNKIIERKSVKVTANNQLIFREQISAFNSTQLKVGITVFQ